MEGTQRLRPQVALRSPRVFGRRKAMGTRCGNPGREDTGLGLPGPDSVSRFGCQGELVENRSDREKVNRKQNTEKDRTVAGDMMTVLT